MTNVFLKEKRDPEHAFGCFWKFARSQCCTTQRTHCKSVIKLFSSESESASHPLAAPHLVATGSNATFRRVMNSYFDARAPKRAVGCDTFHGD